MKYKIYMNEIGDLYEGWYCGEGKRSNSMYYRCEDGELADTFDDYTAFWLSYEFKSYGYPCRVVPNIPQKRIMEILEMEG